MKAEDNPFPYITLVEGAAPAAPSAGRQKEFIDSADHKVKRINSAGAVTTVEGGSSGGGSGASRFDTATDTLWGTDLGYDAEFDTDTSSLPSGWAWLNQGTATYQQAFGAALLADTGTSQLRGIEQNIPAGSSWVAVTKILLPPKPANFRNAGIYIRDGATGKLTWYSIGHTSGVTMGVSVQIDNWTNSTTYSASALAGSAPVHNLAYLAVRKNSATSWDFLGSADGLSWANFDLARNISTFTASPSKIGLAWSTPDATRMSAHWFRVRSTLPA